MAILRLKKMAFFGHHGVYDEERKKGGDFEVDCEIETDISKAAFSDNINDAINYEIVYNIVKKHLEERRYNLMETLARNLLDEIVKIPEISSVNLKVRKLTPPIKGYMDYFEVELSS